MIDNLLLCVGAQKTGTTWLHTQLKDHPQIGFSDVKEVHYFNTIHNGSILLSTRKVQHLKRLIENNRFALEMYFTKLSQGKATDKGIEKLLAPVDDEWYMKHLQTSKFYAADFTPEYALLPDEGFENIKRVSKNQKIIFIMRDPLSRAKSAIQYYYQTHALDISEASEENILSVAKKSFILDMSRYQETISKLDFHFSKENILYMFFEEIMSSKKEKIIEVSKFLDINLHEVDEGNLEKRVNTSNRYEFKPSVEKFLKDNLNQTYDFVENKFGYLPKGWVR
ncbi:sulfotransferase domain-containing protein [Vibrio sp. 1159]|uniref:sulfotransferase domain-containing protein n=1 Tax=Vibrio sp. 1159 TaxID=3074545 RepID=UPI0029656E88|nr:sulfotransferase domain-containing protein [Vibrio sp. 1159]MDW2323631.1 sulfotransferase domain-containing protein [Vibrio sp. 1159]